MEPTQRCPQCGAPMEIKHGPKGDFWGCTMWRETKCKGSARISQELTASGPAFTPQAAPSQFDLHAERLRMAAVIAAGVYDVMYRLNGEVQPSVEDVGYTARLITDYIIRDCTANPIPPVF